MKVYKFFVPTRPRELKYKFGKGRIFCSPETKEYRRVVATYAKLRGVIPSRGPVKLCFTFYIKNKKIADLSNYIKNAEQALQGIAFKNDNQVEEIIARRIKHPYLEGTDITIAYV